MKTIYSTGQVAKICKVAPRTVSKWFDSGRLKGYRLPGSQDRRIPREQLVKFLTEHGMPLDGLDDDGSKCKVLLVGTDDSLLEALKEGFQEVFEVQQAKDVFAAASLGHSFSPNCVVIDSRLEEQTESVLNGFRNNGFGDSLVIVGIVNKSDDQRFFDSKANETFRVPYDTALLGERIRTLVARGK